MQKQGTEQKGKDMLESFPDTSAFFPNKHSLRNNTASGAMCRYRIPNKLELDLKSKLILILEKYLDIRLEKETSGLGEIGEPWLSILNYLHEKGVVSRFEIEPTFNDDPKFHSIRIYSGSLEGKTDGNKIR